MDKKVYQQVSERANGKCEICSQGGNLELHHILRHKVKETQDNCIMLCGECHRGTNGIHGKNGHIMDMMLKYKIQIQYLIDGKSQNEVMNLMGGRIYI